MEEENKGLTLKDVFSTIWLKKWIALIVAVVVVLVMMISLHYGYNAIAKYYEVEFSLNLPGSNGGVAYSYPDGTQFNYTSITSKPALEKVKNDSDGKFADVDVDSMVSKGLIHISRDIAVISDSGETSSQVREITYTISVKANYFSGKAQAKEFLMKLANTPKDYLSTDMKIENGVYLPLAKEAIDYETEIGFLKSQLEFLQDGYEELIKTYGGSCVGDTETGKTLLAYAQEINAYLNRRDLDTLLSQARKEHIVKEPNGQSYYEDMKATLERERDIKQAALDKVLSKSSGSSVIIEVDASVLEMSQEVAELDEKIASLGKYYVDVPETDIKTKEDYLNAAYEEVEKFTDTYTKTCNHVYEKASAAIYTKPGVIVSTGGFGLTATVLMSLVIGVVVALVAAYVAGYLSLKKAKVKAETPSDAASEEQPAAEAEVQEKENKK